MLLRGSSSSVLLRGVLLRGSSSGVLLRGSSSSVLLRGVLLRGSSSGLLLRGSSSFQWCATERVVRTTLKGCLSYVMWVMMCHVQGYVQCWSNIVTFLLYYSSVISRVVYHVCVHKQSTYHPRFQPVELFKEECHSE